jgi:hypothetical protein
MLKKKISFIVFALMLFIQAGSGLSKEDVSYEKYGKIAIAVVEADYPSDAVTDYKFEGRNIISKGLVEDQFLFLVKEKGKKFNVRVKIRHSLFRQKMLNLTVEEVR